MRKKLDTSKYLNADKIRQLISDTPNTVDATIKETFSFKGRKSVEIEQAIILSTTNEGDLIFDPFIGSGTEILATQRINRRLIGTELDNYTYNINKVLFESINEDSLNNAFNEIEKKVKHEIMYLYETECCGAKNFIKKLLFDPIHGTQGYFNPLPNREIQNGKNIKLLFKCNKCKSNSKAFEQVDLDKINEVNKMDYSKFPTNRYLVNSRINITTSTGADYYNRIFSPRNQVALLKLQEAIDSLSTSKEKEFLQHVLVASLSLARIAMYGSSTDILYHVVLDRAQDMNVWELFENRYKKFIKFKKKYSFAQTKDFKNGTNYQILNQDYYQFLSENPDLKFDLIFTDFPYTDQVPYLERNQLFRVWLNNFDDNKEKYNLTKEMLDCELVVTNAEKRKEKDLNTYYQDLNKMFESFSQHLDDYKPLILFMKLGTKKYFNVFANIIDTARKHGFEYATRIGVEKNDPTLRKQSAYNNTLINEVIVGFIKLPELEQYLYIEDINYDFKIIDDVYKLIKKSDYNLTLTSALTSLKKEIELKHAITIDSILLNKISTIIEKNFYISDEQFIQLSKNILYIDQEDGDRDGLFNKLLDLVPVFIAKLFEKQKRFVLEDLYLELIDNLTDGNNRVFQELLSEDRNILMIQNLLNELCDKDDKYYIPLTLPEQVNYDAIDIAFLDAYEFEDLCKNLLLKEGFTNVHRKGGSGDLGVDIVADKVQGNKVDRWLIQCKRWVNNVDATPLQRLDSERSRLGASNVECITTSAYTKDAKTISKQQDIKITDGINLIKRLNKHFPGQYYNSLKQK